MPKITYLGDSITFGQYVDPSLRWTSLIDKRLPPGWTSRNEGVNGETTRLALERFPQAVQADPPDILTIQYGLNDCNRWQTDKGMNRVSPAAFRSNLVEMVRRAKMFDVRYVVLLNNHRALRSPEYEQDNVDYAQSIEWAGFYSGALVCSTRKGLVYGPPDVLLPDGLHLSPAGHQIYADTIWPVLERCIKEIEW